MMMSKVVEGSKFKGPCDKCKEERTHSAIDIEEIRKGDVTCWVPHGNVRYGCAKHPVVWHKFFLDSKKNRKGLGQ